MSLRITRESARVKHSKERERGCVNKICQNFNVLVRGGASIGAGEVVSRE